MNYLKDRISLVLEMFYTLRKEKVHRLVLALLIVVTLLGSIAYYFERNNPESSIRSISDGIWWGFVTITTVGYGDKYPITWQGKIAGIIIMTSGLILTVIVSGTIASILVLDPKILILDEPTAGQDYRHNTDIMEILVELNRLGVTIILITHDMHLMLEYTPRAIVLSGGRMIADTAASFILTNREVIEKANLKETSLYHLAELASIPDGTHFVQGFIDYERRLKNR